MARHDHILKSRLPIEEIDVLDHIDPPEEIDDEIHVSENFEHETTINASGDSGSIVFTIGGPLGEYFTWFKFLDGESTFATLDTGAISEVTLEGFEFEAALGNFIYTLACSSDEELPEGDDPNPVEPVEEPDIMAWATWTGGVITIENDYGITVLEDVVFTGGVIISYSYGNFGKATGIFTTANSSFQLALPAFIGTQETQTVSGDGLLVFDAPPRLVISTAPSKGTAEVVDGEVVYKPNATTDGVDSFEYQVMTQLGDSDTATVNIGTMDLDIYYPSGGALNETVEDNPGLFLLVNDDDDNTNGVSDLTEAGFVDNDLVKLEIKEKAPAGMDPLSGYFTLSFGPSVRVWHNNDKTKPSHRENAQVISASDSSTPTRFRINDPTRDPAEDFILWVEGVSWGVTTISMTWHGTGGNAAYDSVTVSVVGIDVDTDSDNNGVIEGSAWEEELESHEFALGKLVENQPKVRKEDQTTEEVLIHLPKGLSPTLQLRLTSKNVEGPSSGRLELLDHQKAILAWGFNLGGGVIGTYTLSELGYIPADGLIRVYLRAIDYYLTGNDSLTSIGGVPYEIGTMKTADNGGKPDNRIVAELLAPEAVVADEIKVLVYRELDFFISVHDLEYLRSAGASRAVYSPPGNASPIQLADAKIFALRYITYGEMEKILQRDRMSTALDDVERSMVRNIIRSYLYNKPAGVFPSKDPGFQAGLYRDYVTGAYKLAMRGTESGGWTGLADWLTNLQQALLGNAAAYENGILLTWAISKLDTIRSSGALRLTGHSMGGGLASAAGAANDVPAEVFNSAGVNVKSLFRDDDSPIVPISPPVSPGLDPKDVLGLRLRSPLITNWAVSRQPDTFLSQHDVPDILTFLQNSIPWLPDSPGRQLSIEGVKNMTPFENNNFVEGALTKLYSLPKDPANWVSDLPPIAVLLMPVFGRLAESHKMEESIFFGLLHDDSIPLRGWNAYDIEHPRNR